MIMAGVFQLGVQYHFQDAEQFWSELETFSKIGQGASLEEIDYDVRSYIAFAAQFYGQLTLGRTDAYLGQSSELERCVRGLLSSQLFSNYTDRCTDRIVELACTTKNPAALEICIDVLSAMGTSEGPHIFKQLRQSDQTVYPPEGSTSSPAPSVLQVLISTVRDFAGEGLHQAGTRKSARVRLAPSATNLLYEVCKVSRFETEELDLFDEAFVHHLFDLVEVTRDDDEPFNYSLIRLIMALNEQFMVASVSSSPHRQRHHQRKPSSPTAADSNMVIRALESHQGSLKTFGENVIFILNRLDGGTQEDLCVALLILKLLYILFTTPGTHEYFYTNDLCVLVDVFVRELSDLPEESEGLRHTYLRVLHPLLTNTQLRAHPYKRHQIRRVLKSLISGGHLRDVNPTTKRLVERNLRADWCRELERSNVPLNVTLKAAGEAVIGLGKVVGAFSAGAARSVSDTDLNLVSGSSSTLSIVRASPSDGTLKVRKDSDSSSMLSVSSVARARTSSNAAEKTTHLSTLTSEPRPRTSSDVGQKKRRPPPPCPKRRPSLPSPAVDDPFETEAVEPFSGRGLEGLTVSV